MQIICCVCHKTKNNNHWTKQGVRSGLQLSHGYCPQCYQEMMDRIDKFFVLNSYCKSA